MRTANAALFGLLIVCLMGVSPAPGSETRPASQPAIEPKTASLAEAIEDWILLLEKGDRNTAIARWAKDKEAARAMETQWENLRAANKQHDYRKWLAERDGQPGAKQIGDARQFEVGGHKYSHLHISWEKTDAGWRISSVAMCK